MAKGALFAPFATPASLSRRGRPFFNTLRLMRLRPHELKTALRNEAIRLRPHSRQELESCQVRLRFASNNTPTTTNTAPYIWLGVNRSSNSKFA